MKRRVLGRTGLEVGELSMGGLFVASFLSEQTEASAAVKRALELGVNYIDTAPSYGNSEEALGIALEGLDFDYYIATKLGGRPVPFNAQDKAALTYSFEESLRLLKKDRVDLLLIHEPDRPGQNDWWSDKEKFYGPVTELLAELKEKGLIKYIGLGGTTAYQMPRIIETGVYDVVLTAFQYSLLWREAAIDVLPAAKKHNMGIIIGSPLQQGALARKWPEVETGAWWLSSVRQKQFKALYDFSDELNMGLPELGLRFVLSNPDVSTILMGARSVAEVESNVAAVEKGPLPRDVLDRLDAIAAMVPFHPFEEPFSMPFGGRNYGGPWLAR